MIRPTVHPIRRFLFGRYCTVCGEDKRETFSDGEKVVGELCPYCGDRNYRGLITKVLH